MMDERAETLRIFIGGQQVATASNVTLHLHADDEQEQREEPQEKGYSISGTMYIENSEEVRRNLYRMTHFTKKEKRRMMKIITSGYLVAMLCEVNGEPVQVLLDRPRALNEWFRRTHSMRTKWTRSYVRQRMY